MSLCPHGHGHAPGGVCLACAEIAAAVAKATERAAAFADAYFAEVGKAVECTVCRRTKAPRGRSVGAEMANSRCDHECAGYNLAPLVGDLWPGERRVDFGFPALGDVIRAAVRS